MATYGIQHITPSHEVNRQIWRWIRGVQDETSLRLLIADEVRAGFFHPDTDSDVIIRVARETYSR